MPRSKPAEPRVAMTLRIPKRLREGIDRAAKYARRNSASDWLLIVIEDAVAASDAAREAESKPRGSK